MPWCATMRIYISLGGIDTLPEYSITYFILQTGIGNQIYFPPQNLGKPQPHAREMKEPDRARKLNQQIHF